MKRSKSETEEAARVKKEDQVDKDKQRNSPCLTEDKDFRAKFDGNHWTVEWS